ncbi:MAG: hypothetical protein ACRCY4_08805, partial [Brevinema sp.]
DGTDVFGRYHFIPLANTPGNAAGDSFGSSAGSSTTPAIARGQIMYGYLISLNFGVEGSTASAPFNNHFVIVRTDVVDITDDPTAPNGTVRSLILATNAASLGVPGDAAKDTDATTAFQMYNFWFNNGVTPRGGSVIPVLAFNLRDRVSTDVNSRVIELMSADRWVTLTNFPAGSFTDDRTHGIGYTLNPVNHRRITIDNFNKVMIVTNLVRNSLLPETSSSKVAFKFERYNINVREVISDYEAIVQLSAAPNTDFPEVNPELNQRYVYLGVPAGTGAAAIEQRTRDARIIIAEPGAGNTPEALKATLQGIQNENEWNAAAMSFALNQLVTTADDPVGVSEKAFRNSHTLTTEPGIGNVFSYFYSYSPTGTINPIDDTIAPQLQWDVNNWVAFRPLIRRSGGDPGDNTVITNFELVRKGGGGDYAYTNVMKILQADTPRTVFQLAGTTPNTPITVPANTSFSNLFVAVEYGTGLNDRLAKVAFSTSRADVLSRLNAKTTYNYFQGGMATNSGIYEQIVNRGAIFQRGVEWVSVPNTIHNDPANGGLFGDKPNIDPALNILDGTSYDNVVFNPNATTNFVLDPINKTVQESRIVSVTTGSVATVRTNSFIYGYTVVESSLEPTFSPLGADGLPTVLSPRAENIRYKVVLRLEGFGDFKNLFLAGEIGRYDASVVDPSDNNGGNVSYSDKEIERYKARLIFGTNVTTAKAALSFMQAKKSWNFITRSRLTKPSPLLDNTDLSTPALIGLNTRTGDKPATGIDNLNFYSRLATATGAESNVLDVGNHTNFAFFKDGSDISFVTITSIQSNVSSTVRYRLEVAENFFASPSATRRTNDVIFSLANEGSPLHSQFIGLRRNSAGGSISGAVFSIIIGAEANVIAQMGAVDTPEGDDILSETLPITLRYSNDMVRDAGSANSSPTTKGDLLIPLLTGSATGVFSSLDADRVYLTSSNATWRYNDTTKLMTVTYVAPSIAGVQQKYHDSISKTDMENNHSESYRLIPVFTSQSPSGPTERTGRGVFLLRSDESSAPLGFLHNQYMAIRYYGTVEDTATTGAYLVFMTNASKLSDAVNFIANANSSTDKSLYTLLAPYSALDLTPLNRFVSIRNPD